MRNALLVFILFTLAFSLFAADGEYGQPDTATQQMGTGVGNASGASQVKANASSPVGTRTENQTGQGSGQGEQVTQEQQARNQGEEQQLTVQNQEQNQAGINSAQGGQYGYVDGRGNKMELNGNGDGTRLRVRDVEAHSLLDINPVQEQNRTRLQTRLSNGRNAEIKIMPDTASETALMHLRIGNCDESNGCAIQLKEVSSRNEVRAAYVVQVTKRAKLLGIFDVTMPVESEVDAENGEMLRIGKPWWSFLASEQDE